MNEWKQHLKYFPGILPPLSISHVSSLLLGCLYLLFRWKIVSRTCFLISWKHYSRIRIPPFCVLISTSNTMSWRFFRHWLSCCNTYYRSISFHCLCIERDINVSFGLQIKKSKMASLRFIWQDINYTIHPKCNRVCCTHITLQMYTKFSRHSACSFASEIE